MGRAASKNSWEKTEARSCTWTLNFIDKPVLHCFILYVYEIGTPLFFLPPHHLLCLFELRCSCKWTVGGHTTQETLRNHTGNWDYYNRVCFHFHSFIIIEMGAKFSREQQPRPVRVIILCRATSLLLFAKQNILKAKKAITFQ